MLWEGLPEGNLMGVCANDFIRKLFYSYVDQFGTTIIQVASSETILCKVLQITDTDIDIGKALRWIASGSELYENYKGSLLFSLDANRSTLG